MDTSWRSSSHSRTLWKSDFFETKTKRTQRFSCLLLFYCFFNLISSKFLFWARYRLIDGFVTGSEPYQISADDLDDKYFPWVQGCVFFTTDGRICKDTGCFLGRKPDKNYLSGFAIPIRTGRSVAGTRWTSLLSIVDVHEYLKKICVTWIHDRTYWSFDEPLPDVFVTEVAANFLYFTEKVSQPTRHHEQQGDVLEPSHRETYQRIRAVMNQCTTSPVFTLNKDFLVRVGQVFAVTCPGLWWPLPFRLWLQRLTRGRPWYLRQPHPCGRYALSCVPVPLDRAASPNLNRITSRWYCISDCRHHEVKR